MRPADQGGRRGIWGGALALLALVVLVGGCGERGSSTPTRLTDNPAEDSSPTWSPDGRKIAFNRWQDGGKEIYVMDADGSNQTRLTEAGAGAPVWSPDGQKIAFVRDDGTYTMDADGSNEVNLSDDQANDKWPTWSPDGQRIAFASDPDDVGGDNLYEVYVSNALSGKQANLTYSVTWDDYPAWSPDGQKIAFTKISARFLDCGICVGESEIYVMDADGSNQTRLTTNRADDTFPTWSPDGQKIAFQRSPDFDCVLAEACRGEHDIYVMDADGSNQVNLTDTPAVLESGFSWSPDSEKIAFDSWRDDPYQTNNYYEIYVADADGSNQTRLTKNRAVDDMSPTWSPDGEKLAFVSNRDGNAEIYVMDADRSD
jgi:Tol biopolymer transport system component